MKQVKMQTVQIVNGQFSETTGPRGGNFTGEDLAGERYFIPKKKMHKLGIETDDDFKSFYITVTEKTFNELDEDDNVILKDNGDPKTFTRVQAGAVFANRELANDALTSARIMETEQDTIVGLAKLTSVKTIHEKAKELDLDVEAVKALVASI